MCRDRVNCCGVIGGWTELAKWRALSVSVERRLRPFLQHLCEACGHGGFAAAHEAGIVNRFRSGLVARWPLYRILSHAGRRNRHLHRPKRWAALSAECGRLTGGKTSFNRSFGFLGGFLGRPMESTLRVRPRKLGRIGCLHIFAVFRFVRHSKAQFPRTSIGDYNPTFSRDGQTLAYNRTSQDATSIYTMALSGGDEQRLISGQQFGWGLAWTPDGSDLFSERLAGSRMPPGSGRFRVTEVSRNG